MGNLVDVAGLYSLSPTQGASFHKHRPDQMSPLLRGKDGHFNPPLLLE